MKAWFLFILGSLAYFLVRYGDDKKKLSKMIADFDLRYWWRDNWNELLVVAIFDLAAVMILFDPETAIDITKIEAIPSWLILPIKLVGAFILGYGGGWSVYGIFRKKAKYVLDNKKD